MRTPMTKRSTLGGAALVGLALLFIGLTVLFNHALRGWRLDLTENRLYTTAAGTDRILASIKEPINLYFFYSEKAAQQLPQLKTYGTRVREFLEELAGRSNGKLILHVIDPQPFSEEEDRASELGVRAVSVGAASGQFYFGLAGTNSTDGHAAIEMFDPDQGTVPRVRRHQARLPARQSQEASGRLAVDAADGRQQRSADRAHARGLDGAQRGAPAV